MQIFLTIIAVLVIFSLLVLVHEFGHFWAAKRAGVKVLEFGIGFPPRLFSKKHGETVYSVNAVPFGGFVKLYGEDMDRPDVLKSKRSFAGKPPWTRIKIVVAGVLMNFLFAYILLATGFTFGMQPLLLNEQDLFSHLQQGHIDIAPGAYVSKVTKESQAERAGIMVGDKMLEINGQLVESPDSAKMLESGSLEKDIDVKISRAGQIFFVHLAVPEKDEHFGLSFHPLVMLPRPKLAGVKSGSIESAAGLRKGDILLRVNGVEVYSAEDVISLLSKASDFSLAYVRDSTILEAHFSYPRTASVVIEEVLPGSAAEKSGFHSGDFIESIAGSFIYSAEQVQQIIQGSNKNPLSYHIIRGSQELDMVAAADEKNVLGIVLTGVLKPKGGSFAFSESGLLTSLTKIHPVRYPFFRALQESFHDMLRLSALTVQSFGSMVQKLVTKFEVPQDIGGPVRIAYFTHTFVQEGFFALLRFTALLSLSLAVLNIIPIPALDGGRFLFILIELIFRKRVNARFEALVHRFGFILLLVLLALVTYSDFAKIF